MLAQLDWSSVGTVVILVVFGLWLYVRPYLKER